MIKKFTKNDLVSGMVVETNSGEKFLVCGDRFISKEGYMNIWQYDNNLLLSDRNNSEYDIHKVYGVIQRLSMIDELYENGIIWNRTRRMTLKEIERELGYKIEIVS